MSRIGSLTWLIHTLIYAMTIHTYMQQSDTLLLNVELLLTQQLL